MAHRGRKPKPRAQRELEGNPGHRELPPEPPILPTGMQAPEILDAVGRAEWERVYPDLERTGIVTTIDRGVLVSCCDAWSRVVHALAEMHAYLAKHSTLTYRTRGGAWKEIPIVATVRAAKEEYRKNASELGMTPSARTRVSGSGEVTKPKSALDEHLNGDDNPN